MDSESSDYDETSKPSRGPTIKPKSNKGKLKIKYNNKGVPIGDEGSKLATFEGMVARTMVPITYESWRDVSGELKEELWQYVLMHFALDPKSRANTIASIGIKWRNFKHYLFKNYIQKYKDSHEEKLRYPPTTYPFVSKRDWRLFVAQRLSKKWEEKSENKKKVRSCHKYNHRLSRKGYAGLILEIMEETGLNEEEIDRTLLWISTREMKTGGYDSEVQKVVDRIEELQKNSESHGEVTCGSNDVLTQAIGTQENRGHVRGMGKFVRPQQYFLLPKNIKQYVDTAVSKRVNILEKDVEVLKRGRWGNVSDGASCQMSNNDEDFEDEPDEELQDNTCYLAVEVASNIVAKGSIRKCDVLDENWEVLMDTFVHGDALLPIPIKDEFIVKVKDAVGYILSWPRHLVIKCSDLVILFSN